MDRLKDFIDAHADEFLTAELPAGHFARFCSKLPDKPRKSFAWLRAACSVAAAACVACLLIVGVPWNSAGDDPTFMSDADFRMEMEETHCYYRMEIDGVMARIEDLYSEYPGPVAEEIMAESQQVLSETRRFEDKVLPELPLSDSGLYALNCHYTNTVECLTYMLVELEARVGS